MQHKGHNVSLTAWLSTRDFDHKVHAVSWTVFNCAGLLESEQIEHIEVGTNWPILMWYVVNDGFANDVYNQKNEN